MEPSRALQVIRLDQTNPLERGRAYGEAARGRIGRLLEIYQEAFGSRTGEGWPQIVARGRAMVPCVERFAPALLREVEGIAQGAGRSFDEVFLLNARSEILFSAKALGLECTGLLALPEATAQGETLLAQNWDWMTAARDCQVLLEIGSRPGVPPLVTFTEAGQLAKIGMNGAGIGLTVNNLTSDQPRAGVPWIFITRGILESTSLAQAVGKVLATTRAHSMNFMIAHAMGAGVNLETAPVEEHLLWPERGFLAHTNHYLEPALRFRDLKPLLDAYPSTYLRYRRAAEGLTSLCGHIDVPGLQAILRDHLDRPFSVCMHENAAVGPTERSSTCLSIIMNLTRKEIHYTVGNPCEGPFQPLDVSGFLSWEG
jgi:isopenicillin-N N-acyltransferase like protein